eukprot:g8566.t1
MASLFKKKELYFLPLGGCGEIGMNLNAYVCRGKWLIVDVGVTFEDVPGVEVVMPDPEALSAHAEECVGIVLTHAHEDHIGAVAYLWEKMGLDVPIYATPFTSVIVRHKLKEWGVKAKIVEIPLSGSLSLDPFDISFITLTHSIPEPNALAIKTPFGTIVHTGDWKIDPDPLIGQVTDHQALSKLGDEGVLALVCDSTNVFEKGRSRSEKEVREGLIKLVQQHPDNAVVIACFASNVARLASCYEAAKASGRELALCGRSLDRMDQAARHCGYFKDYPPFLSEKEVAGIQRKNLLMVCTGSQGEPRAALTRMARGTHPRLRLQEGDAVIFSSRVIPGNEKSIYAMQNALTRQGVHVVRQKGEGVIHVSGHPFQEELKEMYAWVRPRTLIPVHGEDRHLAYHADFALEQGIPQTIVPRNGHVIRLSGEKPECVGEVPVGRLALDGKQIIPFYGQTLRERFQMMNGGVVFVGLLLANNRSISDFQIQLLGITEPEGQEDLLDALEETIEVAIQSLTTKEAQKEATIIKEVQQALLRTLFAFYGKKPPVYVQLFWGSGAH